jgi:hypothetical protein
LERGPGRDLFSKRSSPDYFEDDSMGEESYQCFDTLIAQLRAEGHLETALRLHTLLHETAWTTGSELIGELGLVILGFERTVSEPLSPELREALRICMYEVRKVWPGIR